MGFLNDNIIALFSPFVNREKICGKGVNCLTKLIECGLVTADNDAQMIPIISMSANAFRDDIQAAYASGMNDYLIKPIDINRLAEILHRFLRVVE
jgi:CheY-like chemotaxis protein